MQAELFKGRTAVVTGGARGIGLACAVKIAAGGGRIAVWDRDMDRAKQSAASLGDAIAVEVDVTSEQSLAEALAKTEKDLAAPDILVASAGITGPNTTVIQYPVDAWKQVIDINLTGVFLSNRAVAPGMVKRGWGRIVNIASVTFYGGWALLSPYVASKGALVGLTRAWAREFGPDGITVNAIAPGAFPTDAEKIHPDPEGYTRFVLDHQAVKRRGTPDDIAEALAFLASDAAGFITGQTLNVDGGWVMH